MPLDENHPGTPLKTTLPFFLVILALIIAGSAIRSSSANPASGKISHGRYLVENVAMCGQCHTPRDANGELILSHWLGGAPVPVQNPFPAKQWAEFAPRIAGLPQYSDEQAMALFSKGTSRTGKQLRGPMPPFRMSEEDAKDVIAYLRSLE